MPVPRRDELLAYERTLWESGLTRIAGIDEAGRGPLAGPVVSACVVFTGDVAIEGIYDSKALPAAKREALFHAIMEKADSVTVGICGIEEIDTLNIYQAAKLSMQKALSAVAVTPQHVLIDAMKNVTTLPSQAVIKGDQKSFTIAAASIIAKVTRDRIMDELHAAEPWYGWNKNKGYPTKAHRAAIAEKGISIHHRRSFTLL